MNAYFERLITGIVIVLALVFIWALAQGVGEAVGAGLTRALP